jgi:glutamine amidotransferase
MIAIIDYEAGNLTSVARAVRHLGFSAEVTGDPGRVLEAERIIFPGVGAAGSAMASLKSRKLDTVLIQAARRGIPILGICLGTQIILKHSQENDTTCLGIIDGSVLSFPPDMQDESGRKLKIPHMGWNRIHPITDHPILVGIRNTDEFYFVHGYYPEPADRAHILCTTDYGISFASVIGNRNIVATQFHLEKSGRPGLQMLQNFCLWDPLSSFPTRSIR